MKIVCENITLRDYVMADVDDEVHWTNVDTAWFQAEAPWMSLAPVDADELRADMEKLINSVNEDEIRWRFEIEVDGKHIGLLSSYYLDSHFAPVPWENIDQQKNALENHAIRALGIEICEQAYWGRGIGTKALTMLMDYYRGLGEKRFLLETWSGNARMLGCAKKMGFREVKRIQAAHVVDGQPVDDLILEKIFA